MVYNEGVRLDDSCAANVATRDRLGFGSKTSISELPSLPTSHSSVVASDDDIILESPDLETSNTQSFVEFDFGNKNSTITSTYRDAREIDTHELLKEIREELPVSNGIKEQEHDLSKQQKDIIKKRDENEDDFFNGDKATWKTVRTTTEIDYYDDKGNLQFANNGINDFEIHIKNGGYTRIDDEEQVARYAELDKKTDFLFITKEAEEKIAKYREEDDIDDSEDENYLFENENIESSEALKSTKDMLDEGQKFSYCGIVRIISVEMATELANIKQSTTLKVGKQLSASQKNFGNWSQYIIDKIYSHMDLIKEEQRMIENLSVHGLKVEDLTLGLLNKTVDNKPGSSLAWVLVCDLFLLLLSDGYYDSRSRSLLMRVANALEIQPIEIYQFERRLLNSLEVETKDKSLENKDQLNDKEYINKYIKKNKNRRLAYVGLATLGGTLAIGLSAGLLAPVIGAGLAAGLTTIGIGGTGGFLAGVGGTTIITTGGIILGAKAGHKAGERRAGEVQTFKFKPLHDNKRSNSIITVSGWMTGKADDVRLPFSTVDPIMGDLFSVLWEPEMLTSMGQTIGILASEALTTSIQQILGATIASSLMAAIQVPVLLSKLAYLVDNPWNVSLDRAWKAGKILADNLVSGNMGVRPITLVGFSLGSRVVYSCLIDLAQRGCFGLIENVIIMGSPLTVNKDQLGLARSVVSNDFINCYSKKDWVLGYLFRATSGGLLSVAGLSEIKDCYGIKNLDVTAMVEGHMSYRKAVPKILKELNWEILNEEFDEIEEPDAEQRERQRKLIIEFDEAKAKMQKEMQHGKNPKKTWKYYFKPKQNIWWKDIGEPQDQITTKEYNENEYEYETPIFDVNAIQREVTEIENGSGDMENDNVNDKQVSAPKLE